MSSNLLEKLEQACAKINELSTNEREVEINGEKIILGILSGDEEEKIQAYIADKIKDFGAETFMRIAKIETVAFAIKAIGGNRIDKIDFFSYTDETSGEELKIERHIYLRNRLQKWPNFISSYLFNQYAILVDEASSTMKPEFKIADFEDVMKAEIEENTKVLDEVAQRLEDVQEATKEAPPTTPSKEQTLPPSGGVLDQSGY